MKLGEIKLEALYLSFPNPETAVDNTDGESLCAAIRNLKEDPNYSDFLWASAGAINRALAIIEARGLTPLVSVHIPPSCGGCEGGYRILDLKDAGSEYARILSVRRDSDGCDTEFTPLGDNKIRVEYGEPSEGYTVLLAPSIKRITAATPDDTELPLSYGVCSLIPYYVKGDLTAGEDPDGAKASVDSFYAGIGEYERAMGIPAAAVFDLYRMEG